MNTNKGLDKTPRKLKTSKEKSNNSLLKIQVLGKNFKVHNRTSDYQPNSSKNYFQNLINSKKSLPKTMPNQKPTDKRSKNS